MCEGGEDLTVVEWQWKECLEVEKVWQSSLHCVLLGGSFLNVTLCGLLPVLRVK